MFGLGVSELIIIGVILLLIFGVRRLPEIGRGLGETAREIKNISRGAKGRGKKKEILQNGEAGNSQQNDSSKETSLKGEIEGIPGVKEIKTVKETVSQVRKWWWFLKH